MAKDKSIIGADLEATSNTQKISKHAKVEIPDFNQFKKRFDNFLSSKNFDYILVKNSLIFKKDEIDELFYENLYEELSNTFIKI